MTDKQLDQVQKLVLSEDPTPKQQELPSAASQLEDSPPAYSYLKNCNGCISQGLGKQYVQLDENKFIEINQPIQKPSSYHLTVALFNLLLIVLLWYALIPATQTGQKAKGKGKFKNKGASKQLEKFARLLVIYGVYLYSVYQGSEIYEYFKNATSLANYSQIFRDAEQHNNAYFQFGIKCFNKRSGKGKKQTSSKYERLKLDQCVDSSGCDIKQLTIIPWKLFTFIDYQQHFSFADDATKTKLVEAYNSFATRNAKDSYQTFQFEFKVKDHNNYVCYTNIPREVLLVIFHAAAVLGLAYPLFLILQLFISRYEVDIYKTVKLND